MTHPTATVPLTPRTATNCIDLAVLYCGRQLPVIMALWACISAPSCALVYVLTLFYGADLRIALLIQYLATAILGGWLAVAVAPGVFERIGTVSDGEAPEARAKRSTVGGYLTFAAVLLGGICVALAISPEPALGGLRNELSVLTIVLMGIVLFAQAAIYLKELNDRRIKIASPILASLAMRTAIGFAPIVLLAFWNGWTIFLAIVFAIVPGIPLAARFGFVAERACLTQYHRRLHHSGTDDLIKSEMAELLLRLCGMALFYGMLWVVLFFTVDVLCSLLFQTHILIGRLQELDLMSEQFWIYLATNPLLLTTLTATGLLAYPFVRIAWFLCYIDLRVRRDCWDLELSLTREAIRLRESG